jgi:hypothetical protein
VKSNRQHLDQSEPINADSVGVVEVRCRKVEVFTHAAVYVDAEYTQGFTTVGEPALTSPAMPTLKIGTHGDDIANCHCAHRITASDDLNSELVPENARVAKKRLLAGKSM